MSDVAPAGGRRPRAPRPPAAGDGQSPIVTLIVLVAGAVAVIAGFVILRSVGTPADDAGDAVGDVAVTATATPSTSGPAPATTAAATTTTTTTTTTAPRVSKSDATVVVANASGVDRSATAMTDELVADGYVTAGVANATGPRLERSIIYHVEGDADALGVAGLIARQIPTAQVLPMPEPPPLDRPLGAATVALILGKDAAGRPLPDPPPG